MTMSFNFSYTGQPIYEDLDIGNGWTTIANPGYNNNLAHANTSIAIDELIMHDKSQ